MKATDYDLIAFPEARRTFAYIRNKDTKLVHKITSWEGSGDAVLNFPQDLFDQDLSKYTVFDDFMPVDGGCGLNRYS